jgi:hypothetical protein
MRRQDGNRPILTFCDILGHFHAIMQCTLSKKLGVHGENGLSIMGGAADLLDTTLATAPWGRRQDAAH